MAEDVPEAGIHITQPAVLDDARAVAQVLHQRPVLDLRLAQALSLEAQIPGQRAREQRDQPDQTPETADGRHRRPAATGFGGQFPLAPQHGHRLAQAVTAKQRRIAVEGLTPSAQAVPPADGDVHAALEVTQPGRLVQALHVHGNGDQSPVAVVLGPGHVGGHEDGRADDQAQATLHQLPGTGEHRRAALHHVQHRTGLLRVAHEVQAQGRTIAFQGMEIADDVVGRSGEVADQPRPAFHEHGGDGVELGLAQVRVEHDVGDQTVGDVDHRIELGFQPGPEIAQLPHQLGAGLVLNPLLPDLQQAEKHEQHQAARKATRQQGPARDLQRHGSE